MEAAVLGQLQNSVIPEFEPKYDLYNPFILTFHTVTRDTFSICSEKQ